MKTIEEVLAVHTDALMAVPGVVGTAIGRSDGAPCIRVFVADASPSTDDALPAELEGYPVKVEVTGPFRSWRRSLALLVMLGGALAGCRPPSPPPAIAPVAAADSLSIPADVGRYHLQQTEVLEGSQGTLYRFTDGSRTRVSVFVYDVPPDVQGTPDPQAWVNEESQKLPRTFPTGVERGWYDDYRLAYTKAEPLEVDAVTVPGYTVAAATRKGPEVRVELQYLYVVRGRFLKVRATVPEKGWAESDVPIFARELVTRLVQH